MTNKIITCTPPGGLVPSLGLEMAKATHLLIAGASGYGKTVALRTMIEAILRTRYPNGTNPNTGARFLFIDPKKIDLQYYAANLPRLWVADYADNAEDAAFCLRAMCHYMDEQYKQAKEAATRSPSFCAQACPHYVIIEEFSDLTTDPAHKHIIEPLVRRLLQLGRAANIHVVLVTQRPTADVITKSIRVNCDYSLALHTECAQDSRNIIRQSGAERLQVGQGLFRTPKGVQLVNIPFLSPDDIKKTVDYWNTPQAIQRVATLPEPATTQTQPRKSFLRSLFGKLA